MLGGGGGLSVTLAFADLVESAMLVAVTITVCCAAMVACAVSSPAAELVPALAGLMPQVTAVLPLPVTVALNCWLCEADRLTVVGLIPTEIGTVYRKFTGPKACPPAPRS